MLPPPTFPGGLCASCVSSPCRGRPAFVHCYTTGLLLRSCGQGSVNNAGCFALVFQHGVLRGENSPSSGDWGTDPGCGCIGTAHFVILRRGWRYTVGSWVPRHEGCMHLFPLNYYCFILEFHPVRAHGQGSPTNLAHCVSPLENGRLDKTKKKKKKMGDSPPSSVWENMRGVWSLTGPRSIRKPIPPPHIAKCHTILSLSSENGQVS